MTTMTNVPSTTTPLTAALITTLLSFPFFSVGDGGDGDSDGDGGGVDDAGDEDDDDVDGDCSGS